MYQQTTRFFLFLFCLNGLSSYGQKEVSFKEISTCEVLSNKSSVAKTRSKALTAIKVMALQKAGVSEIITSNQYLEVENSSIVQSDAFYESTFSDIKGEISSFEILGFDQHIGEAGEILICAKAKVSVIKYDDLERDISPLNVTGINTRYKSNENLSFQVTSSKETYFWIFLIDEQQNYILLYPTKAPENNLIKPYNSLTIPDNSKEKWSLSTSKSDEEKNSILIVTHNTNISADKNTISDFNSWAKWYKKLNYKNKTKQIFNLIIFDP